MRFLRVAALALACAPSIALAQSAPSDTAATHRQAAEQLLTITGTRTMVATMQEQMLATMLQQAPQLQSVEKSLRAFFKEQLDWSVLGPEYVKIYVDVFTEQELRDVTAFYRTPLGQKLLARLPDLMQRSQALAAARVQAAMPKLMQEMQRELMAQQQSDRKPAESSKPKSGTAPARP